MALFYLGIKPPMWLETLDVPMFLSRRRLEKRRTLPRAATRWALDSGGFTELGQYGEWRLPTADYITQAERYAAEIGLLDWVAPQDWMCEPSMITGTGLDVPEHQRRTVRNFQELRQALGPLVIPVLQGWEPDDYLRCVDLYQHAGIDLTQEPTVGLGSVCRRNADSEITRIIDSLQPLRLHAFGVKGTSYINNHHIITSADSMAWSRQAFFAPRLPECTHAAKQCWDCSRYALRWRKRLLDRTNQPRLFAPPPAAAPLNLDTTT